MEEIKAALRITEEKTLKQLKGIEMLAAEKFEKIRSILRKNEVQQQERKMKTKRELTELKKQHNSNLQKFKGLDNNSSDMQMTIFNSTPYNLQQKEEFG